MKVLNLTAEVEGQYVIESDEYQDEVVIRLDGNEVWRSERVWQSGYDNSVIDDAVETFASRLRELLEREDA